MTPSSSPFERIQLKVNGEAIAIAIETSPRITQFNFKRDRGAQIMGLFYSPNFVVSEF